jgi:hypothetical protein
MFCIRVYISSKFFPLFEAYARCIIKFLYSMPAFIIKVIPLLNVLQQLMLFVGALTSKLFLFVIIYTS